jgi:hypothetical protein
VSADHPGRGRRPAGQELLIPALALGFTAYYFWTVRELAWEAKANGIVVGAILAVLVLLLLLRLVVQRARGDISLRVSLGGDPAPSPSASCSSCRSLASRSRWRCCCSPPCGSSAPGIGPR